MLYLKRIFPSSASPGFTLVEILVALSLLAMMGGMTAAFLGQMRRVAELQSEASMRQELDATTRYIERSIEAALALQLDANENRVFEGTPNRVSFVDSSRLGISQAALRKKTIQLKTGSPHHTLEMSIFRRRSAQTDPDPHTVVLLDNVVSLEFRFLDQSTADGSWLTSWDKQRTLPTAVQAEITVELRGQQFQSTAISRPTSARPTRY